MPDADQRNDEAVPARLRKHALARVDEDDGESAPDAPVAMLRVYCSWPGVSATMKDRRVRREIAVGDIDGDALFALGRQAVDQQRQIELVALRAEFALSRSSAASWSSQQRVAS